MVGVGFAITLVATPFQGSARVLPEMDVHIRFAERCAESGWTEALEASLDVIAPRKLRVYLPDGESRRIKAVADAANAWERALDGDVAFEFTDSSAKADVTIKFVDELKVKSADAGGFAEWKRSVRRSGSDYWGATTAKITLSKRAGRSQFSDSALRHAAMHELGHVLGLDDSATVGNVMGPLDLRSPSQGPTLGEVLSLRRLRSTGAMIAMRANQR